MQGRSRRNSTKCDCRNSQRLCEQVGLDEKTLFFCSWSYFFFFPMADQAEDVEPMPQEEIIEAPSEDALNYLLSEDIYQGTLSWQGNKVSTKFNYDKIKKK